MKTSNILNILLATALVLLCIKMAINSTSENDSNSPATKSATEPKHHDKAAFREFSVRDDFCENGFDWLRGPGALLCAGDKQQSNAMTIGWGAIGTLWGKDAITVYVAQSRYTHEFMERAKYFTVMTFSDRRIPDYMGTHSGRDGDKAKALGLHVAYTENGTPYYEEADMVIEARIMYDRIFDASAFKDDVPKNLYADFPAGLHSEYIGEVVKAMRKGK